MASSSGTPVQGVNYAGGAALHLGSLLDAYAASGLQSTQYALAEELLRDARRSRDAAAAEGRKVGLVLAYTSNMVSCGLRETFTHLVRQGHVDAVLATAGGLEEDVIKCLGDTLVGDFALKGDVLRKGHLNRVGNLLIPNTNYANFEDFFVPVLSSCHKVQCETGCATATTPSEILHAMGKRLVENPGVPVVGVDDSLVATCFKRDVPMYCPAFTDGSMGDMLFFYNINFPGMCVDPLQDERNLRNKLSEFDEVNVFCVGSGLPKHNVLRAAVASKATLARVVILTTSHEMDGCTSAASRQDDCSDGQLEASTRVVRINTEATLVVPFLVARVFTS